MLTGHTELSQWQSRSNQELAPWISMSTSLTISDRWWDTLLNSSSCIRLSKYTGRVAIKLIKLFLGQWLMSFYCQHIDTHSDTVPLPWAMDSSNAWKSDTSISGASASIIQCTISPRCPQDAHPHFEGNLAFCLSCTEGCCRIFHMK